MDDDRRLDLGPVLEVRAESYGEPGQRTFRIFVATTEGQVSLWLEKEQIAMLGSALEDLLTRISPSAEDTSTTVDPSSFVGELEVKVGSLALGYNSETQQFSLEASDFASAFQLSAISFLATRQQFEQVRNAIGEILSGSRPRCPLCGTPLTSGPHFCPQSNGHARLATTE